MDEILLSRKRTSEILNISLRTLDHIVAARELRPRRIGRRVLFERREIEKFARRDHQTGSSAQGQVDASR